MSTLIDYASPMMQVEKRLKEMHNELLSRDFVKAEELATLLVTDARLLQNTIVLMKEKEDAVRKQVPSL